MNIKRLLCAGMVALSLGAVSVATNKSSTTVQAYSYSKKGGVLRFTNRYGSMQINNVRVFKIRDDDNPYPLEYSYFINGWFKNTGKHSRSPLSFYNRYFYDEEYYHGKYWLLTNPLNLVPSHFYKHMSDLGQEKIPPHASTLFAIGGSTIPPVRLHSNELFRVNLQPYYGSEYTVARQYFTTGYMPYRHFTADNKYDPN